MARLDLVGVGAGYGRRVAIEGVDLSLAPGEVVAIIGRNGSGKSTLLKVAAGILRPASGRVLLDGEDLAAIPARRAARSIAGVAQEEDVDFPYSVRDVVSLGRIPHSGAFARESDRDRAAVEAALAALDLVELAERPIPSLSGGERRRAFLARALAQEPAVLLLDEPTAHLDLGHEAALLAVVRALARARDVAVAIALHDLNLVGLVADRVVLLDGGRVQAIGPPIEVLGGGAALRGVRCRGGDGRRAPAAARPSSCRGGRREALRPRGPLRGPRRRDRVRAGRRSRRAPRRTHVSRRDRRDRRRPRRDPAHRDHRAGADPHGGGDGCRRPPRGGVGAREGGGAAGLAAPGARSFRPSPPRRSRRCGPT